MMSFCDRANIDNCIQHTQACTWGTGWSTPGEMSENGAKKEIQSFLSDGAALPRETEMRARRFAHSTRLQAQPCTHSLHTTKQSQLTARAQRLYDHNICLR